MNRNKVLIIIMAIQIVLLAIAMALFVSGVFNVSAFIFIVLLLGIGCTTATIITVRKLPPM